MQHPRAFRNREARNRVRCYLSGRLPFVVYANAPPSYSSLSLYLSLSLPPFVSPFARFSVQAAIEGIVVVLACSRHEFLGRDVHLRFQITATVEPDGDRTEYQVAALVIQNATAREIGRRKLVLFLESLFSFRQLKFSPALPSRDLSPMIFRALYRTAPIYYSPQIAALSRYGELINTDSEYFALFINANQTPIRHCSPGISERYSTVNVVKFVGINLAIYRLDGWICYLRYVRRRGRDENNGDRNCIFCPESRAALT